MNTGPKPPLVEIWLVTKSSILCFVALVGGLIVLTSVNYFPPKFSYGFLVGREAYFYSWYAVAFYVHVFSATTALFLGLVQCINWLRMRFRKLHTYVGRIYAAIVIGLAGPSGLALSFKASGGNAAILGFAVLALATMATTYLGYSSAVRKDFQRHRQWMVRSYLLMCSAVLLRFMAGLVSFLELGFITYDALAWLSWLPSLMIYEVVLRWRKPTSGSHSAL